jgi:hypothetical protein
MMRKQVAVVMIALLALVFLGLPSQAGDWALKGNYTESCSCDVPCPCVFGSSPSKGHCDVNSFLEIEKGNLGDVSVDGVTVSLSSRLGNWVKFYFSENTTDEQAKAVIELLQKQEVFGVYFPETVEIRTVEMAALSIERGESTVKFSTPNSTVEIEMLKGLNGEPIHIENLALEVLEGHTQYKSVTNSHKSDDAEFSYTGSNGLTSTFDITSK